MLFCIYLLKSNQISLNANFSSSFHVESFFFFFFFVCREESVTSWARAHVTRKYRGTQGKSRRIELETSWNFIFTALAN
jgi:hypothetical protein